MKHPVRRDSPEPPIRRLDSPKCLYLRALRRFMPALQDPVARLVLRGGRLLGNLRSVGRDRVEGPMQGCPGGPTVRPPTLPVERGRLARMSPSPG